ncbi:MAG: tRNA glutamyl-Q(34) synthetase GluQRS [Wenzhouxiangella sp.]
MPSDSEPASTQHRGRFAPSPTGQLHFGSLLAATGSYLQAKANGGEWLLRIEDIDPPREVPGAARAQIETLRLFGMVPDRPVVWQSRTGARHQAALAMLLQSGQAFHCACSRRDLPANGVYPGTCRNGIPAGREARSVRLKVDDQIIYFNDVIQGECRQNPGRECGDFIIRRADGLMAYQLAVVVDDAEAGVSEVVRGADLIESTGRQVHVYRCLGLEPPTYAHLPLVVDKDGRKLSKSEADDPVQHRRRQTTLRLVLRALGHEPPAGCQSLDALWRWALDHWDVQQVPKGPVQIGLHPQWR